MSTPPRKVLALPVVLVPQSERIVEPITAEMNQDDSSMTGDGRGLSGDLSSLIRKDASMNQDESSMTGNGRGLSGDLSSLIRKETSMNIEFVIEEPMHEPEHRDTTIDDQYKSQERHRLNEVEQVAEARHHAILEEEQKRTRLNQVLRNEVATQEVHECLDESMNTSN
jgi:hypothetical protein